MLLLWEGTFCFYLHNLFLFLFFFKYPLKTDTCTQRIVSCRSVHNNQFSRSVVSDSATPWTVACQASLFFTNSQSLLKLMSIESVMPSNISSSVGPFFSRLQSFPASGSFQRSQFFASGGFSSGPSNDYSGLISFRWTGWISLQSKGLSRVSSNTTVQKHQFFGAHSFSFFSSPAFLSFPPWSLHLLLLLSLCPLNFCN